MNKEQTREKIVAYVGDDQDFINEMDTKFRQKGVEATFCQKSYYPGALLDIAAETFPNIIIFEIPKSTKGLINEEIVFLKKVPEFLPIMIIAIFPDKETLEISQPLASCGVTFFYIKGCEYEHLFRDCQLYGLENQIMPPSFAKATNLKIKYHFNAVTTISAIDYNELYIDTDVALPWVPHVKLELNLLNDGHFREFEVIEHNPFSTLYPMTERYFLKFPFSGPWDEVTEATLKPEVIREYIDNYPGFDSRKDFIWLFTHIKWPEKLFLYSLNSPFHIEHKSLSLIKTLNDLEWKRPLSIFTEVKEDSDEEHGSIMELIDKIRRTNDYQPIIFIFNTLLSSHDLKIRNNYSNIVSSPKAFEFDYFTKILSTLSGNIQRSTAELVYFKKDDINRCLTFELEVTIKSLTEHEIKFEFNAEVPLFSLFQMKLADNIYITIVEVDNLGDNKFLYTGILHGMDEFAYQNLRKIVNQLIYNPKNELTPEEINKILHSPQAQVEQTIVKIESSTTPKDACDKKASNDRNFARSSRYKSKL